MAETISQSQNIDSLDGGLSSKIARLALNSTPDFRNSHLIPRHIRQDTPLSLLGFEFLRLVNIVALEDKESTIAHLDKYLPAYGSISEEHRRLSLEELKGTDFDSYFKILDQIIEDYSPETLASKFQDLKSFMAYVVMSDHEFMSYLPPAS